MLTCKNKISYLDIWEPLAKCPAMIKVAKWWTKCSALISCHTIHVNSDFLQQLHWSRISQQKSAEIAHFFFSPFSYFRSPLSTSVQNVYIDCKGGQHTSIPCENITEKPKRKCWIECALVAINKLITYEATIDKQASKKINNTQKEHPTNI